MVRDATFTRESPVWTCTLAQAAWLKNTAVQYGVTEDEVASALVTHANGQPPETKKYIFLVVKCANCGVGAKKGGSKTTIELSLAGEKVTWLEAV